MKKVPTGISRPSKEERHASRRDEIVDAAKSCVVSHGFHAASMAQIATTAKMSVGQIYRYFPNKEAIIQAIVERIVHRKLQWMVDEQTSPIDFDFLAQRIMSYNADDRDDRILLMEVTAEATRNAVVAAIVREADARIHRQAELNVAKSFPHLRGDDVKARVELMAVLSEGAAFRRVTGQLVASDALEKIYRDVIARVLSPPDCGIAGTMPKAKVAVKAKAKSTVTTKAKAKATGR